MSRCTLCFSRHSHSCFLLTSFYSLDFVEKVNEISSQLAINLKHTKIGFIRNILQCVNRIEKSRFQSLLLTSKNNRNPEKIEKWTRAKKNYIVFWVCWKACIFSLIINKRNSFTSIHNTHRLADLWHFLQNDPYVCDAFGNENGSHLFSFIENEIL